MIAGKVQEPSLAEHARLAADPTAVGDDMAAMDALGTAPPKAGRTRWCCWTPACPTRDGLAVAAMIRERAELAATRIILLTSGERPGDPARVRELRIDTQLLKPVQQDKVLETIHRLMSRSQGARHWPGPRLANRPAQRLSRQRLSGTSSWPKTMS